MSTLTLPSAPSPSRAERVAGTVVTGLFAAAVGGSGVADLVQPPAIVEGIGHLGFPMFFASILGFWKVSGALALVLPVPERLREWAYAGFTFALTGAAASHLLAGDPLGTALPPTVLLALGAASYALRARR